MLESTAQNLSIVDDASASETHLRVAPKHTVWVEWVALRNALKAALLVVSEDESRTALNSVLIEAHANSIRIVACDGHRLVRIDQVLPCSRLFDCDQFSVLVLRDSVAAFVKLNPPRSATVPFQVSLTRVNSHEVTVDCPTVGTFKLENREHEDAVFPPYDQVIPAFNSEKNGCRQVGVNGEYLADAGMIAKLLAPKRTQGLRLQVGAAELDPIRCDVSNSDTGTEAIYVVMPMRI